MESPVETPVESPVEQSPDDPYKWNKKTFQVISGPLQGLIGKALNNPVRVTKRLPNGEYRCDWAVQIFDGARSVSIFCDALVLV